MTVTVFQMDPVESIDINGDSSFALGLEAQARGHQLYIYGPENLSWDDGRVVARARPMELRRERGNHFTLGEETVLNLETDADVVWMRQDPPFDMSYITACHHLERLKGKTLVVNDPEWVRSSPEKIIPLDYPDLMPPTLVSRDVKAIDAFREEHKDIILKPLFGNGGEGVFRVKPDDGNYRSILEMFMARSREPIMAQAFLKSVAKGDKRVILVDGKGVGAINRVPQKGETRSNMHVGGRAEKSELDEHDHRICDAIGPMLKERGLIFVGIDVIGGKLTEINVTSPTGIQELKRFSGIDAAALTWDAIEARL